MKIITLMISLLLIACTSKEDITPTTIIGKWAPTYMLQTKNADGSWGDWATINTLVALPVIEFTGDGRYLTDGKPGANCCYAGNKYSISGNTINFCITTIGDKLCSIQIHAYISCRFGYSTIPIIISKCIIQTTISIYTNKPYTIM